jgi:GxxExxY protein
MGLLFKIYNELGGGYPEKVYQAAVRQELVDKNIGFLEQVEADLYYAGKKLNRFRLDFVIEHKIVLELKVCSHFRPRDYYQILGYLKQNKLDLGILASFARTGVKYKRILRGYSH